MCRNINCNSNEIDRNTLIWSSFQQYRTNLTFTKTKWLISLYLLKYFVNIQRTYKNNIYKRLRSYKEFEVMQFVLNCNIGYISTLKPVLLQILETSVVIVGRFAYIWRILCHIYYVIHTYYISIFSKRMYKRQKSYGQSFFTRLCFKQLKAKYFPTTKS